jgi:thermitase
MLDVTVLTEPLKRPRAGTDPGGVRRVLALTLVLIALPVPAARAADGETRIVVARDPGLTRAERADIRDDAGVQLLETLRIPNTEVVTTDTPKAALAALRSDADVRYAEIDRVRHAFTNDEFFGAQWALSNDGGNVSRWFGGATGTSDADMDVPETWGQSTGSGIVVAIVDTVVQATHPDLMHNMASSANFVSVEADPTATDERDHGTHVAGIIAAERDNGVGVAGIAPDARIMSLRALDDSGSGYDSDIANAFDYAAAHGARIVNASLGGPGGDGSVLRAAIARHPNTLYVVAAGNGGDDGIGDDDDSTPEWPCDVAEPNVVCVGASTQSDSRASFSNYGATSVDLFAPGEDIASTVRTDTGALPPYGGMSGTSMASPAVAAEAALVLAADPALSAAGVKSAILHTVDDKPAFAGVSVTGGRANAQAAVAQVAAATPRDDDRDGVPNAADRTPRGPDTDGDGVPALDDRCPTQAGPAGNHGCPVPATTPAPTPTATPVATSTPVADTDHDGRLDSADACPTEPALTPTGCPVPALRSLKVSARHRRLSARVRADRFATITVRIERRSCRRHHCRYRRVASKRASGRRTTLARKLRRGRYRVTVRLSSAAGRGKTVRRTVRVR